MMSHAARLMQDASQPVHYLYGRDRNGRPCYFFILCPQHVFSLLEKRFGSGTVNMEDYGRVVASGYGRKPDDGTLEMLRECYGVEFSFS